MRATSKLLALALTAALQPAVAGTVSLNFEDLTSISKLTDRYAGSGVTLAGDVWGLTSNLNNCTGFAQFARDGSCGALELALNALASPGSAFQSFTVTLAGGFVDQFSFVYSARVGSSVEVEVLDAQGRQLEFVDGLTTSNCSETNVRFCSWNTSTVKFDGTATSLRITGRDQSLMLDDFQFVTPTAGPAPLPEPASIALAFGALAAAGWSRKRLAVR